MSLTNNILAYWKLDESSGNATDATGGAKTLTNFNTVGYTAALINNGADFGTVNTNKYFQRGGYVGTDGPFSFSIWVKMRTEIASGTQTFLFNATESVAFYLDYEFNAGSRRLKLNRIRNSASTSSDTKTITLGTSDWCHIVGTYSGGEIILYVNGVANAPVAASGNGVSNWLPGGGYTSLGCTTDANSGTVNQYASAYIDEVGLWSRVLTAEEVTRLYNSGVGLPYPFSAPSVSISAVTSISTTSATGNAEVTSDGGSTVIERGLVWATVPNPTILNGQVVVAGTLGTFSGALTPLLANTTYYVRGYATNINGIAYSTEVSFTTLVLNQYEIQYPDINGKDGETFIGQINVTGTTGTITVKLGTTGTSTVINAGVGPAAFSGTYSGLSGLIITRSADFNGTIDNVYYVRAPLGTSVDWSLDTLTIVTAIDSSVFFKRIEDDIFNSFAFYRYLDLLFKDLDGYVTVTVRDEREDISTDRTKEFSVGNTSPGTVSPFQKKRISFLIKNQAVIIGLSNANLNETFSIAQFVLTGHQKSRKMSSPSSIISMS